MPKRKLYTKTLMKPGVYFPGGKPVNVTPQRLHRFADNFRRMKRIGVKIPVPFGHRTDAKPVHPEQWTRLSQENAESDRVKNNAGFVEDVRIGRNGELSVRLDLTNPDARKAVENGSIRDISPEFYPQWFDGETGQQFQDAMTHVALCTHPVATNQQPFQFSQGKPPEKGIWLSNAMYGGPIQLSQGTNDVPDYEDDELDYDEGADVEFEEDEFADGDLEVEFEDESLAVDPEDAAALNELCEMLESTGLHVPDGAKESVFTDPGDFIHHLLTSVKTAQYHQGKAEAEAQADQMEEMAEATGEDDYDVEDPGVTQMSQDGRSQNRFAQSQNAKPTQRRRVVRKRKAKSPNVPVQFSQADLAIAEQSEAFRAMRDSNLRLARDEYNARIDELNLDPKHTRWLKNCVNQPHGQGGMQFSWSPQTGSMRCAEMDRWLRVVEGAAIASGKPTVEKRPRPSQQFSNSPQSNFTVHEIPDPPAAFRPVSPEDGAAVLAGRKRIEDVA